MDEPKELDTSLEQPALIDFPDDGRKPAARGKLAPRRKTPPKKALEDPGADLERRVGRLEFAAGALVRLRVPVRINAEAGRDVLTDLDVVAIGGGFSHVTPDLFEHIRTAIAQRAQFGFVTKVKVVPSGLSGSGPLIGAAALIHRSELVPDL